MRYGDECEGKMLDAKGDSGDKVMQLIKDANTLLEVTYKVGCIFPMVISSEFRMRQNRGNNHRENAPKFKQINENFNEF